MFVKFRARITNKPGQTCTLLQSTNGSLHPPLLQNPACGRVGRQRVTLAGTFPTAPLRTTYERFRLAWLSSDLFQARLVMASSVSAFRISRTSPILAIRSPVPLSLLYHVLGHPFGGHRGNGTHYSPSVSRHYSDPIWVIRELRHLESLLF